MLWNSDTARLMSRSKPIRTLDDLKGMKIRTPSAAQSAQLTALGAIPVDMPANQIYNNLDRGVIDASMIPMSAALRSLHCGINTAIRSSIKRLKLA